MNHEGQRSNRRSGNKSEVILPCLVDPDCGVDPLSEVRLPCLVDPDCGVDPLSESQTSFSRLFVFYIISNPHNLGSPTL